MNMYEKLLSTNIFLDNEYLLKYIDLVENNKTIRSNITQDHHIIPRVYFKLNNLPVDDSDSNLVTLTYFNHVLAHYYLSLCTTGQCRYGNQMAFLGMFGRSYLEVTEEDIFEKFDKYNQICQEARLVNSESHKGKVSWNRGLHYSVGPCPEEKKDKIRGKIKGLYKGHVFIHNEYSEKHVSPELVEQYLNEGWQLGRHPTTLETLSKIDHHNDPRGMQGRKQTEYQKQRASEANSHPRSEEARNKQKETLALNFRNGKYIFMRKPNNNRKVKVAITNKEKYLNLGYTLIDN